MWIFTNNAFVSIVEHHDDPDTLLVRGRFKGDVARFLGRPPADEVEGAGTDYRFRITTNRAAVEKAVLRAARAVRYPNFKGSIRHSWREAVAMRVWSIMAAAQADRCR